jgi:shikimate dehydrogenase
LTDWSYRAIEMTEADLPEWLDQLGPEWAGLSLTRPLKRIAVTLADQIGPLAAATGAANTLLLGSTGRSALNTDVHGIVAAVQEAAPGANFGKAVVLGGGATAASALAALSELGAAAIQLWVRSISRSQAATAAATGMGLKLQIHRFAAPYEILPACRQANLLISALPPGAADHLATALEMVAARPSGQVLPDGAVLLDVAYQPWPSALARAWSKAGGVVVSGRTMLLHQAARQVCLMTGREAPLEAMRAALARQAE